ncbi:MAG TPA: monovalent cation/H+ antiporter subunit A [Gemmatimonadales bacterium]
MTLAPYTLAVLVLVPFAGALLPLLAERAGRRASAYAAMVPPLAGLLLLAAHFPAIRDGRVPTWRAGWLPGLGLDFVVRLDGLAFLFALLVLGIGLLVVVYARYYLRDSDPMGRFYAYLLLFMGAMTGLVTSGNVILIAIFWELTSLASFLLIGFWTQRADARRGAKMALTVTAMGGLALLGGVILLARIAGSADLDVVLASGDAIRAHPLYLPALALILLGAFTKSAQFPFQFWLPAAMAAPTPVSAYLHSATMVKAGVFLLARLHPALAGSDAWIYTVSTVGLVTFVFGAYIAQFKHDLKGVLAYSTVSHLGLITMLLGLASPVAAVAAVFHVINHATFKASLFMAAGIVDHEAGTRDLRVLNGLWRLMPYTTALAIISAAAMAGVPLFNGFLSKEMFFSEALAAGGPSTLAWLIPALATVGGVFSVSYSVRLIHQAASGPGTGMPRTPHEPPRFMRVPVELLSILCVLVGVFPYVVVEPLLSLAAAPVVGGPLPEYSLAIWHGITPPFLMTLIAFAGGILLYHRLNPLLEARRAQRGPIVDGAAVFQAIQSATIRGASLVERVAESRSLQKYVLTFMVVVLAVGAWPWMSGMLSPGGLPPRVPVTPESVALPDLPTLVGWVVLVCAALAAVRYHRRRYLALVVISGVGLAVSLAFVRFSAPDLALTQLLVETATVLLMLLALYYLPQSAPRPSSGRYVRDVTVAGLAGLGAGGLAWGMLTRPADSALARYFLEQSKPQGGGTNVVNVILVDFRGFDTMGEITVMGIAAIGVALMLEGLRAKPARGEDAPKARDRHPLILATVSRLILPFALLVSVYVFLRGHNLPGGGFIAALLAAVALILQYMASGVTWTWQRLRVNFLPVIAVGLGIALLTGVASWLFGDPFLSLTFTHLHIPVIGDVELATAALFDLGVYVAVLGAVMLILARLGRLTHGGEADAAYREEGDPWLS